MPRYVAQPSTQDPSSWNVIDTTRRNRWQEPWVEIALVTPADAQRCAQALNAGHPAYHWLGNTPRCRP